MHRVHERGYEDNKGHNQVESSGSVEAVIKDLDYPGLALHSLPRRNWDAEYR